MRVIVILATIMFTACTGAVKKQMENQNKNIEVVSSDAKSDDFVSHVYATVKNNNDKLCTVLTLQTVYYDKDGKTVGMGNGSAVNIPAGSTQVVDCIAGNINNAVRYEVQVAATMFQ